MEMKSLCLLLLLGHLLPFISCHPTKAQHLDRRIRNVVSLAVRLQGGDGSVHFLDSPKDDSQTVHKALNYRGARQGLALKTDKDAGIFMETNYGIWGCRIQETILNRIIGKELNMGENGKARVSFSNPKPGVFDELFTKRCYQEMENALRAWSTPADAPFKLRVATSQFYVTITEASQTIAGQSTKFRAPSGYKIIHRMAQEMDKLVKSYDATYNGGIHLLGPFTEAKEGILVQQEAISDNGPAQVNVYASGSGHEIHRDRGGFTAVEIEMPWSALAQITSMVNDDCQEGLFWMHSEYNLKIQPHSQVASGSFTKVDAFKLPKMNEDLALQAHPYLDTGC